jgi:replication initiation protein RepC
MDSENCAHRAQARGFARTPTGFRRLTPELLKADRMAEKFNGLPDGVRSPGQLLAALKAAAPRLGIAPRLVHAIDWLFRFSQPQDWQKESRPIVWPSASMQREALGLEPTQVKEINRRLIELGLVTMKDSPNGKRYGQRDPGGRIVEAYGFDLAPLAARYAEFLRVAEEGRAQRAALTKLRRRSTIARKAIAQILETAAQYGFEDEEWRTLARETATLVNTLKNIECPNEMEIGTKSLERRQRIARRRLEDLLGLVDSDPTESENRPHQYTYESTLDPEQDTVVAAKSHCRGGEGPPSTTPAPIALAYTAESMVYDIQPEELLWLTPRLKPYLPRPNPSWPEIVDAADWLRHELRVPQSLWGEACITMGRQLAAVALAIVSTKNNDHFRTSPRSYFYGMVAKAKAGELHLERTLWTLRRGCDTECYAKRRGKGTQSP